MPTYYIKAAAALSAYLDSAGICPDWHKRQRLEAARDKALTKARREGHAAAFNIPYLL
jgi:hypothetical protein